MDFSLALMMFFGGVISHMFAIKIFGTYSKSASYRITFIIYSRLEVGHENTGRG